MYLSRIFCVTITANFSYPGEVKQMEHVQRDQDHHGIAAIASNGRHGTAAKCPQPPSIVTFPTHCPRYEDAFILTTTVLF